MNFKKTNKILPSKSSKNLKHLKKEEVKQIIPTEEHKHYKFPEENLRNSLDISNLNPNLSLNISNSCNTMIQLHLKPEEEKSMKMAQNIDKLKQNFTSLMSTIKCSDSSKYKLQSLGDIFNHVINE